MSGASGGQVPPGPTLFTHFFRHFPARPGGSAGFSLVLRIFRIFEEKEESVMGHIIWQFVKWFAIGVVAFLVVLTILSLDSDELLFVVLVFLFIFVSVVLAELVRSLVEKRIYGPDPEFSDRTELADGSVALTERKYGKERLFIDGKEVLTPEEAEERKKEMVNLRLVLFFGFTFIGIFVAAVIAFWDLLF